jgi:TonB family protein
MASIMDTAAIRGEWIGRVVDERFPLIAWLGRSEQSSEHSAVYLTELDGDPSQKAAIKLMQVDDRDADACIAAWTAAKTLSHPNLTRLLHAGRCQIDGQTLVYVVTEYADEVLSEILLERALTPSEAEEMLGPVFEALQFLHGKGFVHGRLKPSNILVIEDQLKLSSDGIQAAGGRAKRFAQESGPKKSDYDAPELSTQAIAPAADVWSLGMTLAETLTQRLPAIDRSVSKDPDLPESIPQPLAGIVRECLRSDPTRRCTTVRIKALLQPGAAQAAEEAVQSLTPAAIEAKPPSRPASTPQSGPPSTPSSTAPPRPTSRFRGAALIAAALVVLIIIAFEALRPHRETPLVPAGSDQTPETASAVPAQPQAAPQTTVDSPTAAAPQAPAATQATVPAAASSPVSAGHGAVGQRVMPDIPAKAIATIQGKVQVEIRAAVDASGAVTDAVIESDGHGRYFAKLALDAVRRWKFTPPEVNGHATPSAWTLHFVFRQTGTEVTTVETE